MLLVEGVAVATILRDDQQGTRIDMSFSMSGPTRLELREAN